MNCVLQNGNPVYYVRFKKYVLGTGAHYYQTYFFVSEKQRDDYIKDVKKDPFFNDIYSKRIEKGIAKIKPNGMIYI